MGPDGRWIIPVHTVLNDLTHWILSVKAARAWTAEKKDLRRLQTSGDVEKGKAMLDAVLDKGWDPLSPFLIWLKPFRDKLRTVGLTIIACLCWLHYFLFSTSEPFSQSYICQRHFPFVSKCSVLLGGLRAFTFTINVTIELGLWARTTRV